MKLELMACLLHNPEVIFLDEPTIGLDLIAQNNIREFLIQYHQERKATIILTSHYMADVEALCSRIVLILDGKKKFDSHIDKFKNILKNEKQVTFIFEKPVQPSDECFKNLKINWDKSCKKMKLQVSEQKLRKSCVDILNNTPVIDFYTEKTPIEEVMSTLLKSPKLLENHKGHSE